VRALRSAFGTLRRRTATRVTGGPAAVTVSALALAALARSTVTATLALTTLTAALTGSAVPTAAAAGAQVLERVHRSGEPFELLAVYAHLELALELLHVGEVVLGDERD